VADCAALEMLCTARYRGFKSPSLRSLIRQSSQIDGCLLFCARRLTILTSDSLSWNRKNYKSLAASASRLTPVKTHSENALND
jgi:hypothetical protein